MRISGYHYIIDPCKKRLGLTILTDPEGNKYKLQSYFHPNTCPGIGRNHLDVILPSEDICGIKEYFRRSGDHVRFFLSGGILSIDIGEPLGYFCSIEIAVGALERYIDNKGFVYVMTKHDGNLYIAFPEKSRRRTRRNRKR